MATLTFPQDQAVGHLDWAGSFSAAGGPVLAHGTVDIPDDADVSLNVQPIAGTSALPGGSWEMTPGQKPVDLEFVLQLPTDVIRSLTLTNVAPSSIFKVCHLAPGLTHLYLPRTGLDDDALPFLVQLKGLSYWQSWGNDFTDAGIQQLAALSQLESLYLEEDKLTGAAFAFTRQLPRLERLGLQDVPITDAELIKLQEQLPGVRVS